MDAEVRWSARARREFNSALSYLNRRQPDAVETVALAIASQVQRLQGQPYLGAVFQQTPRGEVREMLAANYRIFYRVQYEGSVVRVVSIRHARRVNPDFSK
jgi:plasmid stabilization system protein ParE